MRAVVLGVGNILLSDEGIGVHAVNLLAETCLLPDSVTVIDGGTSGMDCLDQLADSDLLLIADCMRSGQPPGTITCLEGDRLRAFFKTRISPHQVGVCDVLATMTLHGIAPTRIVLVGIEPESFALGLAPTATLAARLPDMAATLARLLSDAGVTLRPRNAASGTA